MNNEVVIKPLNEYTVQCEGQTDVFTADGYEVNAYGSVRFYRTGNLIREYFERPFMITVKPADEANIPK